VDVNDRSFAISLNNDDAGQGGIVPLRTSSFIRPDHGFTAA
jgi:hypothetical protein